MHEQQSESLNQEISQQQLQELADQFDAVAHSPHATIGQDGKTSISASNQPFEETNRMGHLAIEPNPSADPQAFLGVRHIETGFGPEKGKDTEVLYTLRQDIDGKISLHVSDIVSTAAATALIAESADFNESIANHPDTEMVAAAKNDMDRELSEAFTLEAQDLSASLKKASPEDYKTLSTLVTNALSGNVHTSESEVDKEIAEWEQRDAERNTQDTLSPAKLRSVTTALRQLVHRFIDRT
jgi:hypothetical protein